MQMKIFQIPRHKSIVCIDLNKLNRTRLNYNELKGEYYEKYNCKINMKYIQSEMTSNNRTAVKVYIMYHNIITLLRTFSQETNLPTVRRA